MIAEVKYRNKGGKNSLNYHFRPRRNIKANSGELKNRGTPCRRNKRQYIDFKVKQKKRERERGRRERQGGGQKESECVCVCGGGGGGGGGGRGEGEREKRQTDRQTDRQRQKEDCKAGSGCSFPGLGTAKIKLLNRLCNPYCTCSAE